MITADGSSTVGPFATKAAEDFKAQSGVDVTVGISGTGGGFERFCVGETDLSNASRAIRTRKRQRSAPRPASSTSSSVVATDALTNVVNSGERLGDLPHRRAAERDLEARLDDRELEPGRPVVPGRPAPAVRAGHRLGHVRLLHGRDQRRGGREPHRLHRRARTTTSSSRESSGERGGLGYFGFSYFEENQDTLKAVEVDGGSGCVAPSVESAQDGTYTPLSRPLFVYVSTSAFDGDEDVRDVREVHARQRARRSPTRPGSFRSARSRSTQSSEVRGRRRRVTLESASPVDGTRPAAQEGAPGRGWSSRRFSSLPRRSRC